MICRRHHETILDAETDGCVHVVLRRPDGSLEVSDHRRRVVSEGQDHDGLHVVPPEEGPQIIGQVRAVDRSGLSAAGHPGEGRIEECLYRWRFERGGAGRVVEPLGRTPAVAADHLERHARHRLVEEHVVDTLEDARKGGRAGVVGRVGVRVGEHDACRRDPFRGTAREEHRGIGRRSGLCPGRQVDDGEDRHDRERHCRRQKRSPPGWSGPASGTRRRGGEALRRPRRGSPRRRGS